MPIGQLASQNVPP
jgi:hypothetical protein